MTQEILNPVTLPEDLNPAEQRLADCLKEGQPCTVGDGSRPETRIEAGHDCNVIRERVLCFFIFGGNEEHPTRGSAIELYGAYIPREEYIIDIHFTRIPYGLIFSNCLFTGKMHLIGVECAELDLTGSRLEEGLIATGLKTTGSVFLGRSFFSENTTQEFYAGQAVQLSGARIDGDLDCGGGKFCNPDGGALIADGLKAGGDVLLSNGFSAEGEVRLIGASVGGDLDCTEGQFSSQTERALIADRLTAKGNVFFSHKFSAKGEVRLSGASIGGDLACVSGKISAQVDGLALSAEGLTTGGSVSLSDGFTVTGEVRFPSANIGQDFECKDGKLHNPGKNTLNASGIKIRGNLLWGNIEHEKSFVDLSYASAAVLKDNQNAWGSFEVDLRGFTYDHFDNFGEVRIRLDNWLNKRPEGTKFSPLPYEQAAKTLFGMGHIDHAREILLEKERQQTKNLRWGPRRIARLVLRDWLAGYGYRIRRTFGAIVFFVAVGWVAFYCIDKSERMVPHQPAVLSNVMYQEMTIAKITKPKAMVGKLFPDYPEFNALLYSVDVFIPFFALHQEPYWYPKPLDDDPLYLRLLALWYWIEIAAGWVLTSLLLLSITGLLRPRQESGTSR